MMDTPSKIRTQNLLCYFLNSVVFLFQNVFYFCQLKRCVFCLICVGQIKKKIKKKKVVVEMGNFFKQFKDAMVQWDQDQDRLNYLNDVKTYIQTGSCLRHKNKMLYLPLIFDYSSSKMAKTLGLSPNTVRSAVHVMSEQLQDRFGLDFFHAVEVDFPAASKRLYVVQNYRNLDGLFLPGFTTSIAGLIDEIPDHAELKDCQREIDFLKRYTSSGLSRELATLDEQNLRYVLFLVSEWGAGRGRFGLIHEMLK